ncbi:MAG: hypothetical protein ACJAYU_002698 [Bradymonadia bacterium]|jgi:hypothetical protein
MDITRQVGRWNEDNWDVRRGSPADRREWNVTGNLVGEDQYTRGGGVPSGRVERVCKAAVLADDVRRCDREAVGLKAPRRTAR